MLEYIILVCVKFFTGGHHVAKVILDVLRGLLLFGRHRDSDAVGVVLVGGLHVKGQAVLGVRHWEYSVVHYGNNIAQVPSIVKGFFEIISKSSRGNQPNHDDSARKSHSPRLASTSLLSHQNTGPCWAMRSLVRLLALLVGLNSTFTRIL